MNANNTAFSLRTLTDRNTLLHLRVPFSYYLFPVFWFGISQASNIHASTALIVFTALHFFIYPGSNIYNSYMDKDEGAIGGLEHPPPVTRGMYYVSMVFDITGLLICCIAGPLHTLVMCGYVAFSKAYSWTGIRLKKMPYLGWASVAFFQGGFTFMLANMAATDNISTGWFSAKNIECMLIASLMIGGSYPLTQIYQHEEDGQRGDFTISYRLGIRGTFIFSVCFFLAAALVTLHYFTTYYSVQQFLIFAGCLTPLIVYFTGWMLKSFRNPVHADYRHAMWMNKVSATCMIVCFSIILWMNN